MNTGRSPGPPTDEAHEMLRESMAEIHADLRILSAKVDPIVGYVAKQQAIEEQREKVAREAESHRAGRRWAIGVCFGVLFVSISGLIIAADRAVATDRAGAAVGQHEARYHGGR